MVAGLLAALGAALLYGGATVLEAVAAQRVEAADHVDPRLLVRMLGQLRFVAGIVLDLGGFALSILALRSLPLFAVQAAIASSIGVTALLEVVFLKAHIGRRRGLVLVAIAAGLVLLAASAAADHAVPVGATARWLLAAGVAAVAVTAGLAGRVGTGDAAAARLGLVAGLGFGGMAVCARVIVLPHHLLSLAHDALAWELAAYGVLGMLLLTTAMQRGTATAATAACFAAETVVPAIIGVAWLGDRARSGLWPAAIAGFALTAAGSVVLARLHDPERPAQTEAARASLRSR